VSPIGPHKSHAVCFWGGYPPQFTALFFAGSITAKNNIAKYYNKMTERASNWSVTLNMKTVSQERCEEFIESAKGLGWGIEGQIEEGEEGTRHYQLLVKTPQIRFSAVKKVFPTAHIEKARNVAALRKYVHKDDTRVEEFKTVENKFVQFKEIRDKFFEWVLATYYPEEQEVELNDADYMGIWDKFIGISITEGIECDVIGVNPQYRSCIMRYWKSYVRRQIDRQTDRQTETSSEASSITQDDDSQRNDEEGQVDTQSSEEDKSDQDGESQTASTVTESINSGSSEELYTEIRRDALPRDAGRKGAVQRKYRQRRRNIPRTPISTQEFD